MTLEAQIKQQRVKHIISSYQLDTGEEVACGKILEELSEQYSSALIELALVETLAQNWANLPMPRGVAFFEQVRNLLMCWESDAISVSIEPEHFQQITGLDPMPAFGASGTQPPPSILNPR
jgi:hypothetical protein